jgi:hypothetical protein
VLFSLDPASQRKLTIDGERVQTLSRESRRDAPSSDAVFLRVGLDF